jgi:long-subunit acyl-CoA synthetase (AMP-forming)
MPGKPTFRKIEWPPRDIAVERRPDGVIVLQSRIPLRSYGLHIPAALAKWAVERPDRTWLGQRSGEDRAWRRHSYGDAKKKVDALTQGLLGLGLEPGRPQGLLFSGRVAEDFKLTTGTFVEVGPLRADAIAAAAPVIQDALVAGQDRPYIGLLAWPNLHACRQLVGDPAATYADVVKNPAVLACLKNGLQAHNACTEGASSVRIARAILMAEPASIDGNELTDKGTINQHAGLDGRADLVERLYANHPGEDVILLNP